MGRHKFRLSDMIPNAWFFKLRDMRVRGGAGAGGGSSPRVVTTAARAATTPPSSASRLGKNRVGAPNNNSALLPHRASHYYTPRAGDHLVPANSPSPLHHHHPKASDTQFPPLPLSPPRRSSSARRRHHHHHHHRGRRSVKLALAHSVSNSNSNSSSSSSSGFVPSSPVSTTGCRCGARKPPPEMVEAPDTPPCRRDRFVGFSLSDDDEEDVTERKKRPTVKQDAKVITSATEIIIDLRSSKSKTPRPEKVLRPIVTKPAKLRRESEPEDKHVDVVTNSAVRRTALFVPEQSKLGSKPRRSVSSSAAARRLKTRANTPRISISSSKKSRPLATTPPASRTTKPQPPPTRPPPPHPVPPLAESFAVVKSSLDPRRDFRESMEEMIAENGIRTAADLEDLLACYLALNAAEYHDLIVDVFERVWATLADIKMH